jgi:hypothetical protein
MQYIGGDLSDIILIGVFATTTKRKPKYHGVFATTTTC